MEGVSFTELLDFMKIFIALILLVLSGCKQSASKEEFNAMPEELKDCKLFTLNIGFRTLYVVRCPHSETGVTWTSGKVTYHTSLIDI